MINNSKSKINQNSEELFVVSGLVQTKNEPDLEQQKQPKNKFPDGQEESIWSNMLQNTNVQTSIYTDYEYSNQTKCCDLCGKIFITPEAFQKHMNSVHEFMNNEIMDDFRIEKTNEDNLFWVAVDNKNELHVCDICNQSFDKKHILDIHISFVHLNSHIAKEVHEGKKIQYSPIKDSISTDKKNRNPISEQ